MTPESHRLRVTSGPQAGRTVAVDGEIVIGRDSADLTIADADVSRRHARVTPDGDALVIEDLGSLNGTFVDGKRIDAATRITSFTVLRVGKSEIDVVIAQSTATRLAKVPTPIPDQSGEQTVQRAVAGSPPAVPADDDVTVKRATPAGAAAAPIAQAGEDRTVMRPAPAAGAAEAAAAASTPPASGPPASEPPASEAPPKARSGGLINDDNRRWWGLGAVCLALAMSLLDTTVVNVALPTIQRDLHGSIGNVEWTVNAYTLAFAVFLVIGGRMGDIFGRRRMFLFGVIVFAVASAACGLANDMTFLVISRAVQGIGAGFMMPATLSLIRNTFPLPELGRAIGIWAGVSGVALAAGPLLGGLLTQGVSWRAVFYINIPLAIVTIVVTLITVPESRDETAPRRIDVVGMLLLATSITALVVAIIQADDWGWTSSKVLGLFAVAIVAIAAFVFTENHVKVPLLPLVVFRRRQFVGATSVGFALSFAMLTVLLYTAIYMQSVLGYGPIEAGALLLPATVPIMFAGPIAAKLVGRFGFRPVMAAGLSLVAVAALVQTRISPSTGYLLLLPSFILLGCGIGLTLSPTSGAAITSVPPDKAGAGAGILNMGRQIGGALGIAITGAIVQSLARSSARSAVKPLALSARARSSIVDNVATGRPPATPGHVHIAAATLARIQTVVHNAYIHGISHAMYVPCGVALVGVVLAWTLVRPPRDPRKPSAPVIDADVSMVAARSGNWLVVPAEPDAPVPVSS